MKSLKDVVRKVIAHKHLGKEMIGAITLNEIRKYFKERIMYNGKRGWTPVNRVPLTVEHADEELIRGYVKFNKIFIKTQDQGLKIEIFKKKQDILARVNEALAHVGYATKMVEILIK